MVGVDAPTRRWWAWLSSALAITTTVAYVAVISAEGNNSFWEVFPWVILMLVGTGAALTSALVRDQAVSRAFAIGGAVVLGDRSGRDPEHWGGLRPRGVRRWRGGDGCPPMKRARL